MKISAFGRLFDMCSKMGFADENQIWFPSIPFADRAPPFKRLGEYGQKGAGRFETCRRFWSRSFIRRLKRLMHSPYRAFSSDLRATRAMQHREAKASASHN